MAYTPIDKSNDYFNTVLWTGTGSAMSITGVGFQPDWVWYKGRSFAYNHGLFDVVRGTSNFLQSNSTDAEQVTSGVTAFDSDGFSLGSDAGGVGSGVTFVGWNWKANGAGVSNTAGSITSTVSANTTSGFSIVSYTGTGANATVGHGLGVAPKMVIFKNRDDGTQEWDTYHIGLTDATYFIQLNSSNAQSNTNGTLRFNSTAPSSTLFSVGTSTTTNASGEDIIAYCFAEKKGFSKAFSYTGNGSADGVFTYCGFKPAFLLVKSTGADNWCMLDNKRDTFNVMDKRLFPNLSNAESTGVPTVVDFVSNGFKLRTSDSSFNLNGQSFIGFAIAEHPFVTSTSVPTTAR
jgi:hypothetical protein